MNSILGLLLALVIAPQDSALKGARTPAFATDGRMAVSIDGDLYVQQSAGGKWMPLTKGAACDRDPVWGTDGKSIIYSSNRAGVFSLWRIPVAITGTEPERLTNARDDDSAPSLAPDGSVAFVRGFGGGARIWTRAADGSETRLTTREQAEIAPAYSPDGSRIAYVQLFETGRRLIIRTLANSRDGVAVADRAPERLAWSPDGSRIVFSTPAIGGRAGIYAVPANGSYTNFVASRRGDVAWSPNGAQLAIAEIDEGGPGYNGDPARLGDRAVRDPFSTQSQLVLLAAPTAPDADRREAVIDAPRDRAERNSNALDQIWERSATLYFSAPAAADRVQRRWPRAVNGEPQQHEAVDDGELAAVDDREEPLAQLQLPVELDVRDGHRARAQERGRAGVQAECDQGPAGELDHSAEPLLRQQLDGRARGERAEQLLRAMQREHAAGDDPQDPEGPALERGAVHRGRLVIARATPGGTPRARALTRCRTSRACSRARRS